MIESSFYLRVILLSMDVIIFEVCHSRLQQLKLLIQFLYGFVHHLQETQREQSSMYAGITVALLYPRGQQKSSPTSCSTVRATVEEN